MVAHWVACTHWADMRRPRIAAAIAAVVDLVIIVAFVVAGRDEHNSAVDGSSLAGVAAPFVVAAVLGWMLVGIQHADPLAPSAGAQIWAVTVVMGMVLRRVVTDGGTAIAFVGVAAGFLGLGLIGWRSVWRAWRREPTAAN